MTPLPTQDDDGWHSMQEEEFRARIRETIADELGGELAPHLAPLHPKDNDELREAILKQGTVKKAKITFSQKMYSNNTASPIEMSNQDIVEIGIDDLIHLITTHTLRARREELMQTICHKDGWNVSCRDIRERVDEIDAELNHQKSQKEGK